MALLKLTIFNKQYFKDRKTTSNSRQVMYKQEVKRIYKILNYNKKKKYNILDIGCGDGSFLENFDNNFSKNGLEISDYALKVLKKKTINCSKKIDFFKEIKFDLIIFRGSIQLIDTPFEHIKKSISYLKKKGILIFLATPNSNSIFYKINKTLPMIDDYSTYYLPSDIDLGRILKNFEMEILKIEYPYIKTPYSNLFWDHFFFLLNFIGLKRNYAFYKNSMEVYARKK